MLLDLPPELLLITGRFLDRPSLSCFSRSCKYLHALLTPVLHAAIFPKADEILFWAAENNSLSTVNLALSNGALLCATDDQCRTPLHIAASNDSLQAAKVLISIGAEIDEEDEDASTPLHLTAQNESVATAYLLLESGADKEAEDNDGYTPLHDAAMSGNLGVARALLEHRAPVDARSTKFETPLHLACGYGSEDLVRLLLDAGASVNALNQPEKLLIPAPPPVGPRPDSERVGTPLHWAVLGGHTGLVKLLLAYGADVKVVDEDGRTALHAAAVMGREKEAVMLLKAGVPLWVKDREGKMAAELARGRSYHGLWAQLAQAPKRWGP